MRLIRTRKEDECGTWDVRKNKDGRESGEGG